MTTELQDVINQSTFTVAQGKFVYVKLANLNQRAGWFMVTQDGTEITGVARTEDIQGVDIIERNKDDYALISLNVAMPFYCVGFLAEISKALAAQDMNILIVSTYSKDYVLVRYDLLERAQKILLQLGFKEGK